MLQDLWNQLITFAQQYVVPDWGALVNLIPILLLILVVWYVTWSIYRFATAGPTRRGIRKLPPVPPAGVHMPGPTLAPFLAAFGAFMFMFGLIAHGIWLWIGLVVLALTLLYWGREALRHYDDLAHETAPAPPAGAIAAGEQTALIVAGPATAAAASGAGAVALPVPPGALRAPEGTPPEGVHIPAPSFRPILVAISMTILLFGFVVGGWALILGIVALVVTCLGWGVDALREYRATEAADRTGHLDAGATPKWPIATFAVLAIVVAFAALLTSDLLPNSTSGGSAASGAPGPSGAPGGGGGAPSAAPSIAADAVIVAQNVTFTTTAVDVPAGKPFKLALDNHDSAPHNVDIKDSTGKEVFKGEIFTGPKVTVYDVPALPPGQYPFQCSVHPNMTGTITSK